MFEMLEALDIIPSAVRDVDLHDEDDPDDSDSDKEGPEDSVAKIKRLKVFPKERAPLMF